MDPMQKMWVSFIAIGLMVIAALLISFARAKTRGILRFILSLVAFVVLLFAILFGFFSIV